MLWLDVFFQGRQMPPKISKGNHPAYYYLVNPLLISACSTAGVAILCLGWKKYKHSLLQQLLRILADDKEENIDNISNRNDRQTPMACFYCQALLSDPEAAFCQDCGKPVPNQVVMDEPQTRDAERESSSRSISNSAGATTIDTRIRTIGATPTGSTTTSSFSVPCSSDTSTGARSNHTTTIGSENQLAQPTVSSSNHPLQSDSTSAFSSSDAGPPPMAQALAMHSHYDNDIPFAHAEPVLVADDVYTPNHYSNAPRRRNSQIHAALCQNHAPVVEELRNLMQSMAAQQQSTNHLGNDRNDIAQVNNNSRAAQVLSNTQRRREPLELLLAARRAQPPQQLPDLEQVRKAKKAAWQERKNNKK